MSLPSEEGVTHRTHSEWPSMVRTWWLERILVGMEEESRRGVRTLIERRIL